MATAAMETFEGISPETARKIKDCGPGEVYRRLLVFARVARRNDSPLALELGREANLIAQRFNLGQT